MEEEESPIVSQQILDPEALATAVRSANLDICQLSKRPLPSVIGRVMCRRVCLDFASLGPAMALSGSMPQDCYTLVFVTECPEKGRAFNFSTEHTDGYMGFFPPGELLDAYTPEGYSNATLTVPAAIFLAAVERLFPEIPEGVLKRGACLRIGVAEQARLRALLSTIGAGMEDRANPLAEGNVRKPLEDALLDAFLTALRSGCSSLAPDPGRRVEGRIRRLRQARDYMADHLHQPIHLEDLCSVLGMSRRGVEVLFQDSLGIGPSAFLRHQRLHGVRRALLATTASHGVVKETALQWGFWHMGHFAQEYQSLFGEKPRMTLARSRDS
jgi:AraC family ethanolamine operon transcriptional activator